jgi:hypothetical protein
MHPGPPDGSCGAIAGKEVRTTQPRARTGADLLPLRVKAPPLGTRARALAGGKTPTRPACFCSETSLADVAFNSIQVPLPVMDPVFTRETWVMRIVACSCTYLLTYMYMSMLISLLAGIFLRACCCVCMHRQRLLCLSLMLSPYSPCVLLRVHAQTTFAVPQPHALSIHGCCQQHLCSRTPAGLQVAHQRR